MTPTFPSHSLQCRNIVLGHKLFLNHHLCGHYDLKISHDVCCGTITIISISYLSAHYHDVTQDDLVLGMDVLSQPQSVEAGRNRPQANLISHRQRCVVVGRVAAASLN